MITNSKLWVDSARSPCAQRFCLPKTPTSLTAPSVAVPRFPKRGIVARMARFALSAALFASLIGFAWTFVATGMLNMDPLFGAHARLLCPRVCPDCRAPYLFPATDRGHQVCCSDSSGRTILDRSGHAYPAGTPVPGQETLIAATVTVFVLPAGALMAAFSAWCRARKAER
jgi:hypothetical protein